MIEDYYIYIAAYAIQYPFDSDTIADINASGYTEFKKQMILDGQLWDVISWRYNEINLFVYIIKPAGGFHGGGDYDGNFESSNKVFNEIIASSGLIFNYVKPILLRNFGENEDFSESERNQSHIFYEESGKNKIVCFDKSCYFLKTNLNSDRSKIIINNIITLLSFSEITLYMFTRPQKSLKFYDDYKNDREIMVKITDAIWRHKFYLLNCQAILLFPELFKQEIAVIDNLLNWRYMNLSESQNNLLNQIHGLNCRSMDLSENQTKILNDIHRVEYGILILTVFITMDIVYKLSLDALELSKKWSLGLAIFIAIIILILQRVISKKL
ncbi:MAG TPA: hypothetical protein P5049_03105 [Methanothrix sp.]|nr:hypothetical protein [Methanothrix sp.]